MYELLQNEELMYLILIIAIILFIIFTFSYVFLGFAYMRIAKNLKLQYPGLSWIPIVGPGIIAYKASKMHWWPWILIGIMYVSYFIDNPFINDIQFLISLVSTGMVIAWSWKMFERLERPGWWALLFFIPIVNFVIIGIAAWSDKK